MQGECEVSTLGKKSDGRHGGLKVQLVGEGEERRAEVRDALADLGDPVLNILELEPNPEAVPDASIDVTMVVFNGDDELALSYLNAQAGQEPRPALFALLRDRSPDLMKRVLRAGADELLFLPLDAGDATRALLKISETRRREEVHNVSNGGGTIVSLVSLIGGTGVTSLAGEPRAGAALRVRQAGRGNRSRSANRRAGGVPESRTRAHDHGAHRGNAKARFDSTRISAQQACVGNLPAGGAQADRGQRVGHRRDGRRNPAT